MRQKIGALEGGIYGVGEGEGVEGTATSAALGAGLGAAAGYGLARRRRSFPVTIGWCRWSWWFKKY